MAVNVAVWLPVVIRRYGPDQVGDRMGIALGWFVGLALLTSPVVLVSRGVIWLTRGYSNHRRDQLQRQFDARICTECGYDLRTLPDRCPECGAPREKWWA